MQEYRVFFLGTDGHVRAAEEFYCASDDEACLRARAIISDCPVREVWSRDRRVAIIPPNEQVLPAAE
jgi:hypothetical protein